MMQAGKLYELVKPRMLDAIVFNDNFQIVATLTHGSIFVILEIVGEYPTEEYIKMLSVNDNFDRLNDKIYKIRILTSDGFIGLTSLWNDELKQK